MKCECKHTRCVDAGYHEAGACEEQATVEVTWLGIRARYCTPCYTVALVMNLPEDPVDPVWL